MNLIFKKIHHKQIIFPILTSFLIFKYKTVIFCGRSEDDEEKQTANKLLNHKLNKLDQKLDYLLEKEKYKITLKDIPKFSKFNSSLLKQVLDESVWRRNHMLSTEEGININNIIQSGLDNPDHPIGVVALSKDCYITFDEILQTIAQIFHNRNIKLSKYEKENYNLVISILSNMNDIFSNLIKEFEISTNRNLNDYLFSGAISRSDRRELARYVLQFIKLKENDIFEENGKFLSLDNKKFSPEEQNQFYRSCGFYRDWPDARYIYVNCNDTLSIMVNEEDHLKIVHRSNENINLQHIINYFKMLQYIDKDSCYDEYLGYLNSIPNNLGSGSYFKIRLIISDKSKDTFMNHFKNITDLSVREIGTDNDRFIIEISNNTSFYNFSSFLVEIINIKDSLI